MRNPEKVLNTLKEHSNDSSYKYERLYRILFNEQMFYAAYQNTYANHGNMTAGTDGKTIDQMSIGRIERLIERLKDESYSPTPSRRVYIEKKDKKSKRPLGVPSYDDKLVQEVVRMILEAIYEGAFQSCSHGFRPYRSCHTALKQIKLNFRGTRWFIEGDIKGFFDNIDHNVMIDILRERITDERFLRLIRKFLNAGYFEHWKFHKTYSGTPQGGIISPILANIYLDKFDKYIKEYAEKFNKGRARRLSQEYQSRRNQRNAVRRKYEASTDTTERATLLQRMKDLRKDMLTIPAENDMDETFRRLKYVRYADDFLIGIIGTKAECEKIKADITLYMQEQLRLELSEKKTLITNAQDAAKFLGFEISCRKRNTAVIRRCDGSLFRPYSGQVVINVSYNEVKRKLMDLGTMKIAKVNGKDTPKPCARRYMIREKVEDIVNQYNTEVRGFYNYYCIANNIPYIGWKFNYFMQYSMFHTIAAKHNCHVGEVNDKYRRGKDFVVPYKDAKGKERVRVYYNEGFKHQEHGSAYLTADEMPNTTYIHQPTLVERLMEKRCELCGAEGTTIMHHVRKLTLLKGNNEWEKKMLSIHRKTLAVCGQCNAKIQSYENKK